MAPEGTLPNGSFTGALRLGAAALALAAVIGPMGTVITFMVARVNANESRLQAHLEGDGHPVQNERLNTTREGFEAFREESLRASRELDDKLQKEIHGQTGLREEILRTLEERMRTADAEREVLRLRIRQLELVAAKGGVVVP